MPDVRSKRRTRCAKFTQEQRLVVNALRPCAETYLQPCQRWIRLSKAGGSGDRRFSCASAGRFAEGCFDGGIKLNCREHLEIVSDSEADCAVQIRSQRVELDVQPTAPRYKKSTRSRLQSNSCTLLKLPARYTPLAAPLRWQFIILNHVEGMPQRPPKPLWQANLITNDIHVLHAGG